MKFLNLGCGTKTSSKKGVINIDWTFYLRLKRNFLLKPLAPLFLKGDRYNKYKALPDNILVHNLAKGIPFSSDSVDIVYHSHMLEHLDREVVESFLLEIKRVLKQGGILRIVVPDFEIACKSYLSHIELCEKQPESIKDHDSYISLLLEQSVRKRGFGAQRQNSFIRIIENFLIGDARKRGETHQWMYDRFNLSFILNKIGFTKTYIQDYNTSLIPDWNTYRLDVDENGNQYKPNSLYIEAIKE